MNAQLAEVLFTPALLVDVAVALLAGETLLGRLPAEDPERERVRWRVLELRGRLDPAWALAELDREPPPAERQDLHDRLRAEALIGLMRVEEAERILERHGGDDGAAWLQMRAQVALWRGETLRARELLDQAVAAAADDPERKSMAMVLRIHVRSKLGEGDAIKAEAEELEKLLTDHGAMTSAALATVHANVATLPNPDEVAVRFSALCVEDTKRRLSEGYEQDQATIGPVPLHVHGMLRRYQRDPDHLVREVFNMVGLQYRAKQLGEAYATMYYAVEIGRRVLDEATARKLGEGMVAFREVLGPEETRQQRAYLEERQRAFVQSVRTRQEEPR